MTAFLPHNWLLLGIARRLGTLVLLAAALLLPACQDEEEAQASAQAISSTAHALRAEELLSINGSYGAGCAERAGLWSTAFADEAVLDNPLLSVVLNDSACQLTLTELRTTQGLRQANPVIPLGASFGASPSEFGTPLEFFANAKLSSVAFAEDFVLTVLFSDDPRLATRNNTAIAIPPTVVGHTPADAAVEVSIATRPTVTFSVPMDPATLTALTFTLRQGLTPVDASVTYDAPTQVATLTPWTALELDLPYEVRVTTGARDTGDTPLAEDFVWTFTTALCSQGPVDLGSTATFAVLAGSTVTNTGPTLLTGDLGLSPGTSVTGFPPGALTGTIHAGDAAADQAISDLSAAYNEAEARTVCPIVVAGELGGQTLTPGLYRSTSSLGLSSGNLTLNALGEVDAVFVFQISSTFIVDASRRLILINGAQAANIYWQVGSSATFGTGSDFAGTVLADQSITLVNGAVLTGRALARVGAVTMDSNQVGEAAP